MQNKKQRTILKTSTQSNKQQNFNTNCQSLQGNEVFVSLKKSQPSDKIKKKKNSKTSFSCHNKNNYTIQYDPNTIENTIKQLLKGKSELFNYLQSQKQFISIIGTHDSNLMQYPKHRGKLSSSLTQKKKSRIDTHAQTKNKSNSNFNKIYQNKSHQNQKKTKNQALTVEVVKKNNNQPDCQQFNECRQCETISFQNSNQFLQINKKEPPYIIQRQENKNLNKAKKLISQTKQNNPSLKSKNQIKMQSPKRKKPQLNNCFDQNTYYATKYGLTNFSPWAFPKNQVDLDMQENRSVLKNENIKQAFKQRVLNNQINKKSNYITKQTLFYPKQASKLKNKPSTAIKDDRAQKQNVCKRQEVTLTTIKNQQIQVQKKEDKTQKPKIIEKWNQYPKSKDREYYLRISNNKEQKNISQPLQQNMKIVKSSQVVILQSVNTNGSDIFASKQYVKQMFHTRKSLKNQLIHLNDASKQPKLFQTEIDLTDNQKKTSLQKVSEVKNPSQIFSQNQVEQGQLVELKKTQQFLKQIISSKNSVSYANSRQISKKQFKNLNQLNYQQCKKRSNLFMTKNLLQQQKIIKPHQISKVTYSSGGDGQNKFLQTNLKVTNDNQRRKFYVQNSQEKQNFKSQIFYEKYKARTSLDYSIYDKNTHDFAYNSNNNNKCLTQASINGVHLISQQKIKNNKNSFARRKRHSMLVRKKTSAGNQTKQDIMTKKHSHSVDKQAFNYNRNDLSILQESKGFKIINPLTKQLYKKYASIIQNKRH